MAGEQINSSNRAFAALNQDFGAQYISSYILFTRQPPLRLPVRDSFKRKAVEFLMRVPAKGRDIQNKQLTKQKSSAFAENV
jgi:hypothetical protein